MSPMRKNKPVKKTNEILAEPTLELQDVLINGSSHMSSKEKSPSVKRGRPSKKENNLETNGVQALATKTLAKKASGKAEKIKVMQQKVKESVKSQPNGIPMEGKTKRGRNKVESSSSVSSEKDTPVAKRGRPAAKKPESTISDQTNGAHGEPPKMPLEEIKATKSPEKKSVEKRTKGKQKKPMKSKAGSPSKKAKLQENEKTERPVKKTEKPSVVNGDSQMNGTGKSASPAKRGRKPKTDSKAVVKQKDESSKPFAEQQKSKKLKKDAKNVVQEPLDLSADDSDAGDKEKSSGALKSSTRTTPDGRRFSLKLSTFNVSGLRAWFDKNGRKYLTDHERPDILFLQETKISNDRDITDEMRRIAGYHSYFQHSVKKGYAGVALYSKIMPMTVTYGLNNPEHDEEGRLITAEYEKFYLVGAYVPNSSRGLTRLDYRQKWNKDLTAYLTRLDAKKPVIFCGDLNVAHQEIDLANPKTNRKNAGFTDEERGDFGELLSSGFIDAFRKLYPKRTGAYTFWSNMHNSREKNVGWRLDYFVISQRLEKDLCDCMIRSEVKGSDHCPVTLFMAL